MSHCADLSNAQLGEAIAAARERAVSLRSDVSTREDALAELKHGNLCLRAVITPRTPSHRRFVRTGALARWPQPGP